MKKLTAFSLFFFVFLILSAEQPASGGAENPERQDLPDVCAEQKGPWTPAGLEHALGGEDPIGGYNRVAFAITDYGTRYVVRPLGTVWSTILPRPILQIIENVCHNVAYPRHVISCLGSAEWIGAWDETVRFFVNSTLGLGGMFDPAKYWFHFYPTESDFGRMFAVWGIGPGCTFLFPLCSFVNVRDGAGAVLDYVFDGRTYIPYSSWTYFNQVVMAESAYSKLLENSEDRYHLFRTGMLARRELQLKFWEYHARNQARTEEKARDEQPIPLPEDKKPALPPGVRNPVHIAHFGSDGALLDTMRSIFTGPQEDDDFWYIRLSLFNSDFVEQAEKREVVPHIKAPHLRYEYRFWPVGTEKHPAKDGRKELTFVLPGIGGYGNGNTALAMAELLRNSGRYVVTVDSVFTPAFTENTAHGNLPGYAPRDARAMKNLLDKITEDLSTGEKAPGPFDRISVVGWSFGGLHTLHLAALYEKEGSSVPMRFLALNPPADLDHALKTADDFSKVSEKWTMRETVEKIAPVLGAMLLATEKPVPPFDPEKGSACPKLSISEDQAKFIIALSFRMSLRDVLLARHLQTPLPGLKGGPEKSERMALLEEIDAVSFGRYADEFLRPDCGEGKGRDVLAKETGLRALEKTLKNNPDLRVIHTADDFLLSDADRIWLSDTLGGKLVWMDQGGHLGNLHTKVMREKILSLLE